MKILHICPAYYPAIGGAETHIKELSESLAARNHEVTVLTSDVRRTHDLITKIPGGLSKSEDINGVRIIRFDVQGGAIGRLLSRWYNVRGGHRSLVALWGENNLELLRSPMTLQIIPHIIKNKVDIVAVVNWFFPMAYQVYLAKKCRKFNLIGFPLFHTTESWSKRALVKKMAYMFDALIVNTEYEALFARDLKIKVIEIGGVGIWPGAFDSRNGLNIRKRYGIENHPVVGFVGRPDRNKGIILLIDAMKLVWGWNRNARLILAGPKPERNGEVETRLLELKREERDCIIQITDFPENEKASIYDSFDVFVLPSTAESFGIAYLEAWMCEKPVIGGRIGSTQTVIRENVDGLLVDTESCHDLAKKIIELIKDKDMQRRMGKAGYAKTISKYTWDRVSERVEKTYQYVVDSQRKARFK